VGKAADWHIDAFGEKRIYTTVSMEVNEWIRPLQAPSRTLKLRQVGGEKDGVHLEIPGSAQFVEGEEGVFFGKASNEAGVYDVLGLMLGKLKVEKAADGSEVLKGGILAQRPTDGGKHDLWTLQKLRQWSREHPEVKEANHALPASASTSTFPSATHSELSQKPSDPKGVTLEQKTPNAQSLSDTNAAVTKTASPSLSGTLQESEKPVTPGPETGSLQSSLGLRIIALVVLAGIFFLVIRKRKSS
jgi:hypothetical protein